jgi:hypothetical protein
MNLPKYLCEGVEKQSPDRLRRLAEYAEQMADWKEAEAERELEERAEANIDTTPDNWDANEWEDVVDDARDEADLLPSKETLPSKRSTGATTFITNGAMARRSRASTSLP